MAPPNCVGYRKIALLAYHSFLGAKWMPHGMFLILKGFGQKNRLFSPRRCRLIPCATRSHTLVSNSSDSKWPHAEAWYQYLTRDLANNAIHPSRILLQKLKSTQFSSHTLELSHSSAFSYSFIVVFFFFYLFILNQTVYDDKRH